MRYPDRHKASHARKLTLPGARPLVRYGVMASAMVLAAGIALSLSQLGGTSSAHVQAPAMAQAGLTTSQEHYRPAVAAPAPASAPAPSFPRSYTVKSGDTLSAVARAEYGHARFWTAIYVSSKLGSCSLTAGQKLTVPAPPKSPPAIPAACKPKPAPAQSSAAPASGSSSSGGGSAAPAHTTSSYSGGDIIYNAQIEALWEQEGGSSSTAATAVCIADSESGDGSTYGKASAESPTGDYGLFQIHGRPDLDGNAAANTAEAVRMSNDGQNWSAWSTAGKCGV